MYALKIVSLTVIGLLLFDQLGLWLERKGYVYWRHKKPKSSSAGNALMELNAMFNPGARHCLEISNKEDTRDLDDLAGDDKDRIKSAIKSQTP